MSRNSARDNLLGKSDGSSNTGRPNRRVEESDETRNYDSQQLLQQQQSSITEQDSRLDDILNGVTRLKIMSTDINQELHLHHQLLGELDDQIDRTDSRIKSSTRTVADISDRDSGGWCSFCTMVLLLVLVVIMATTNWFCFLNVKRCH